jgi:hypothetical protein
MEDGKSSPREGQEKEAQKDDFLCTPYEFSNNSDKEVDYNKLIESFGTKPIPKEMLAEIQRLTGEVPHILLRRGKDRLTRHLLLTQRPKLVPEAV